MKRYVAVTAALAIPVIVAAVALAVHGPNDAHSAGPVPAVETGTNPPATTPATEQAEAEAAVSEPEADAPQAEPGVHSIWDPYTRAQLDELQAAVDEGHQPWRADPVSVAEAFLRNHMEIDPVMGAYRPLDAFSGEVPYRGKPLPTECGCPRLVDSESLQGRVLLRRLGGPGSVFFVVGQRSPRVSVTSSLAGRTLTLTIRAKISGEVTAVAGPLRSEATANDYTEVVAGEQATLVLKVGARQFPLLVRIFHSRGPGLPARVTEFRLDRLS